MPATVKYDELLHGAEEMKKISGEDGHSPISRAEKKAQDDLMTISREHENSISAAPISDFHTHFYNLFQKLETLSNSITTVATVWKSVDSTENEKINAINQFYTDNEITPVIQATTLVQTTTTVINTPEPHGMMLGTTGASVVGIAATTVQNRVEPTPEAKPEVLKPDNTPNPLPDTKPETNTPQPLPDNKPDNSGAGVSDNTNTNTNTDTNTSTNTNENTNSPSTSTSTGGASTYRPNNNTGGNASTNSGTVQVPQEPAASTTTPTTPDTTTGTNSGAGDSLDVISIDKETPKTTGTTTNSSGGSNVIPIGLGVAAAGAAAVAGVRYIKNKTNKEDDDTNYEEGDTSFSYLGDYHEDKTNDNYEEKISTGSDLYNETIEEPSKYKAGSVNKLVLDTGEDIKIEDDEMINQKEELE